MVRPTRRSGPSCSSAPTRSTITSARHSESLESNPATNSRMR
jgi:hypothetical protein